MNVNDIYSCIPLDTPIETIVYQVESMTPDEVDKNNAILQRVINKVLNSWLKNRFKKFQCYCFALNEFEPKHLSDNSTEIRLSIMPGYDNSCQANVS